MDIGCFKCIMRENMRKMQFQKTSDKCRNMFFLCCDTVELGSKLKKKIMSQHKSVMSQHKSFMSRHKFK